MTENKVVIQDSSNNVPETEEEELKIYMEWVERNPNDPYRNLRLESLWRFNEVGRACQRSPK